MSREELLAEVWGYNAGVTTHTLETHVYRLRQKIERDPSMARLLLTGAGRLPAAPLEPARSAVTGAWSLGRSHSRTSSWTRLTALPLAEGGVAQAGRDQDVVQAQAAVGRAEVGGAVAPPGGQLLRLGRGLARQVDEAQRGLQRRRWPRSRPACG